MEYTVSLKITVPDEITDLMGDDAVMTALTDRIGDNLTGQFGSVLDVEVTEVTSGSQSGSEFGKRGAVVASEPRTNRPAAPRREATPGAASTAQRVAPNVTGAVRTGRPATLHDLEASDGEPVRASGPRSPEVLKQEGIAVRKIGADAWPRWYQRLMEQQSGTDSVEIKTAAKPADSGSKPTSPTFVVRTRRNK